MSNLLKDNLALQRPYLLEEWDYNRNIELDPYRIGFRSHKNVFWKCEKGHEWQATPHNRSLGQKCPFCSGKRVLEENSIFCQRKDLMEEWDYEKNIKFNPKTISLHSNYKVWWRCKNDHSFSQIVEKRVIRNQKCPYCSGRYATNANNLLQRYSHLCKEWDSAKNIKTPNKYTYKSGAKVWWKCKEGHSWQARISSRTAQNSSCPKCSKIELKDGAVCDSKAEAILYLELQSKNKRFEHHKIFYLKPTSKKYKFTFDFYLPESNEYIESTSYTQDNLKHIPGRYFKYLRKIVKKRKFVRDTLMSKFTFYQKIPSKKQMDILSNNLL